MWWGKTTSYGKASQKKTLIWRWVVDHDVILSWKKCLELRRCSCFFFFWMASYRLQKVPPPTTTTTTTTITLLHYRFTSLLQPLLLGDGIETMEIFIYLCYFFAISFSEHMDGWRILHQSMGTSSHDELRSLVHPRWWMVSAIASIIFARCIGYSIQTGRFCLAHTFAEHFVCFILQRYHQPKFISQHASTDHMRHIFF